MTRRTLLQTLMGTGLQAVAAASPVSRWQPVGPPRLYRTVGRNPRGAPVLSWQDALSYMQNHPKFQKDLTVLLPQGLNPEVREAYWPRIVQDVHGSVEMAQAHHFMNGTCPICSAQGCSHCQEADVLSRRFQRLVIPRGTQYLALTEGQDGRVTYNRIFVGDAVAYRVNVLDGRAFVDLIARCRNTALGQRQEWETYTAFTPPAPGTVRLAGGGPGLPGGAPLPPLAPAVPEAVAGSRITNNYYPAAAPPMAYIGPGPAQFYPRNYQAGSLTLWFQPNVTVGITQTGPAATGAVAGAAGRPQAASAAPTAVAVGPSTFSTPAPVATAARPGTQTQASPAATPTGSSLMQFPSPQTAQAPGPVTQSQGPQQR